MSVRFGEPHHHLPRTDSTNDRARELAAEGAPAGTVVTAGEQSAGRGRQGRTWSAPAGAALLYSAILRPLDLRHLLLPIAVPVAVCAACEAAAPVRCEIKWPNDIWLERRKLGGVLIEARPPEWAVIGIGVNLDLDEDELPQLRWPAASLGHEVTPDELRPEVDRALAEWVEAPGERVLAEFARRDALRGRRIGWEPGGDGGGDGGEEGVAEGIDERGNLLVRTDAGKQLRLGSGEVHLKLLDRP